MMCGLFSIFDPCLLDGGKSVKWGVSIFPLVFVFQVYSIFLGNLKEVGMTAFLKNMSQALGPFREGGSILFSVGLSLFLLSSVGLVPFTFSVTSHLVVGLSLSSALWFSGVLLSFGGSWEKSVSHLLPKGSPAPLWPFLVLIESVSLLIRPFTLAVRLMANVMAGHLILSLIGKGGSQMLLLVPSSLISSGFLGFELGVALVQAYVFVSLLSLYWEE